MQRVTPEKFYSAVTPRDPQRQAERLTGPMVGAGVVASSLFLADGQILGRIVTYRAATKKPREFYLADS